MSPWERFQGIQDESSSRHTFFSTLKVKYPESWNAGNLDLKKKSSRPHLFFNSCGNWDSEWESDLPKVTHEFCCTQVICFLFDLSNHVFCSCIMWSHYPPSVSFCERTNTFFHEKHTLTEPLLYSCRCSKHKFTLNSTLLPLAQGVRRANMSICQE